MNSKTKATTTTAGGGRGGGGSGGRGGGGSGRGTGRGGGTSTTGRGTGTGGGGDANNTTNDRRTAEPNNNTSNSNANGNTTGSNKSNNVNNNKKDGKLQQQIKQQQGGINKQTMNLNNNNNRQQIGYDMNNHTPTTTTTTTGTSSGHKSRQPIFKIDTTSTSSNDNNTCSKNNNKNNNNNSNINNKNNNNNNSNNNNDTDNNKNRYRKNNNNNNHSNNNNSSYRTNSGRDNNNNNNNNNNNSRKSRNSFTSGTSTLSSVPYPSYWDIDECKRLYNVTTKDTILIQQQQQNQQQQNQQQYNNNELLTKNVTTTTNNNNTSTSTTGSTTTCSVIKNVIRGKIKVLPGNDCTSTSFISCDRGYIVSDICILNHTDRNRSIHGDNVYIELVSLSLPITDSANSKEEDISNTHSSSSSTGSNKIQLTTTVTTSTAGTTKDTPQMWQDDTIQMNLWNPIVPVERQMNYLSLQNNNNNNDENENENNYSKLPTNDDTNNKDTTKANQWFGRVVYVIPPVSPPTTAAIITNDETDTKMAHRSNNNNNDNDNGISPTKIIVGTIQQLPQSKDNNVGSISSSPIYLFNPMNRSLPQFKIIHPQITSELIHSYIQQAIDDDTARAAKTKKQRNDSDSDDDDEDDDDDNNQNDIQVDDNDDDWEDVEGDDDNAHDDDNDNKQNEVATTKKKSINHILFQAVYVYGSWKETYQWPPCIQLQYIGQSCTLEDEIQSLLIQYDVNHGDHNAAVVSECYNVVQSGLFYNTTTDNSSDINELLPTKESIQDKNTGTSTTNSNNDQKVNEHDDTMNWKPTPDMYVGRKDYRNERIFTIDPTTARDLDDALHIRKVSDTVIEIGVHIADVSYFVDPITTPLLDNEAKNRATTVYLVDRVIPMLPRPLCEIACSLNENVERLCFSCVWKMNIDGTIRQQKRTTTGTTSHKENDTTTPSHIVSIDSNDVWYGRTVIKSCARLDYSTAQNIIDNPNLWTNNTNHNTDEEIMDRLWPKSRRPVNGSIHSMEQIAADVRLMNTVAIARRKLRFMNGALELSTTKITFQLDPIDHQTPIVATPYIIRDSNKLVEEYMLLANYLVAQRLITHCGQRACIRHHPPPLQQGLGQVKDIAKIATNCDIDISNSQSLQQSLWNVTQQLGSSSTSSSNNNINNIRNPIDNQTTLQCITQLLMTPMKPAEYIVAGYVPAAEWKHFALNIPYYTHFTSPIRRYPDIIVHRLLQESIDIENKKRQYKSNKKNNKNINNNDDDTSINNNNKNDSENDEGGDVIFEEKEEDDEVVVVDDQVQTNVGEESVKNKSTSNNNSKWDIEMIHNVCNHCNDRRMDSKAAQDRCDRIFLALFVRDKPLIGQCGIVLSVGISTCTVFIPQLGFDAKLYLQEHTNEVSWTSDNTPSSSTNNNNGNSGSTCSSSSGIQRCIRLQNKRTDMTQQQTEQKQQQLQEVVVVNNNWTTLDIKVFTRLKVSVICKDIPPIDIKIHLEGPWV